MTMHQQQRAYPQPSLSETRHFDIDPNRNAAMIQHGIEQAFGERLIELTPGLWQARRDLGWMRSLELMVRVLPEDEGASIEVTLTHRTSPVAVTAMVTMAIAGAFLILPLLFFVAISQRMQEQQQTERVIEIHKVWTHLALSLGAPKRATYRDAPQPVALPMRAPEPQLEPIRIEEELEESWAEGKPLREIMARRRSLPRAS